MNILVFLPRFPYPLDKGDKLRAFNQIKELSQNNDIYLFALTRNGIKQEDFNLVKQYCKDIFIQRLSLGGIFLYLLRCLFTNLPLQVALFTTNKAKKNFSYYFDTHSFDAVYFQFVRSIEYAKIVKKKTYSNVAKRKNSRTRLVLDFQDCLSMNMYRRAKISSLVMRLLLQEEARRLRLYERKCLFLFDATTIITEKDRDCIVSKKKDEIKIIANGVDKSFFSYDKTQEKEYEIIFSGNMSYKPNIVAAKYLINCIMPLVWKARPKVKVCLVGSSPVKEVMDLRSDRVEVTGWVEDMREYYSKSLIYVAPMQIGTGLQNKLLEAMAMQLPCITTPIAFCALNAKENQQILVGKDEKELALLILNLLDNKTLRESIAKEGNSFVRENYSWQKSTLELEKLLAKG
jgi:polysaccharide biosynthesis protein PslH